MRLCNASVIGDCVAPSYNDVLLLQSTDSSFCSHYIPRQKSLTYESVSPLEDLHWFADHVTDAFTQSKARRQSCTEVKSAHLDVPSFLNKYPQRRAGKNKKSRKAKSSLESK